MSKEVTLNIPDKMPNEGFATDRQRMKILQLAPQFPREQVAELGKLQASVVIDQLIAIHERQKKAGDVLGNLMFMGIIVVGLIVVFFWLRSCMSGDVTAEERGGAQRQEAVSRDLEAEAEAEAERKRKEILESLETIKGKVTEKREDGVFVLTDSYKTVFVYCTDTSAYEDYTPYEFRVYPTEPIDYVDAAGKSRTAIAYRIYTEQGE